MFFLNKKSKFIVLQGHRPYIGQPYHVSGGRLPAIYPVRSFYSIVDFFLESLSIVRWGVALW